MEITQKLVCGNDLARQGGCGARGQFPTARTMRSSPEAPVLSSHLGHRGRQEIDKVPSRLVPSLLEIL